MKIPILLTATINCANVPGISRNELGTRYADYLDAIQFYLEKTPNPIVFVENSGHDLSEIRHKFIKYKDRLELISIDDNEAAQKTGKGAGECESITSAIFWSSFMEESEKFIKITGRYKTLDIFKYGDCSEKLICRDYQENGNISTVCYIVDKNLFYDYFTKQLSISDYGTLLESHFANFSKTVPEVKFIPPLTYIDTYTSQGTLFLHD